MNDILNKPTVLVLNRNWQAINVRTPADAFCQMATGVATDNGRIRSARLALGGVAHKPWRLTAAEAALRGASLDDSNALKSAIAKSFADARPLAHNAFKVELAQRAALRALQTAGART